MSLDMTVKDDERAEFTVKGKRGQHVTFDVRLRHVKVGRVMGYQPRYVVGLKGSDGDGFAHFTIDAVSRLRARRARQNTIGQSREVHIDLPPKPLPEFVMPTCGHAGCIAAAVVLRDRLAAAIAAGIAQDTEREWAAMNGDAS